MHTTSTIPRSALRLGLVAIVVLALGLTAAGPAVANPGIDPQFQPGGDGPEPPEPPPPGPQDEGLPPTPPPPPPEPPAGGGSGGGSSSGGGAPVDLPPAPETTETTETTEAEPEESDADDEDDERAADTIADDGDRTSALLYGLGALAIVLATAAGLFLVVARSRRDEEDDAVIL